MKLLHQLGDSSAKFNPTFRASEDQYRATLNSMKDSIHVVDSDLTILLMNDRFLEWCTELGLEAVDPIGKTIFDVFPHLPDRVKDEYRRVFASGEILTTVSVTEVHSRGIETETRKIPVYDGDQVVRVVTVIKDITEQERIRRENKATEDRIHLLFETIPHAIYECDKDGIIGLTNSAYARITGYSRDELPGMHVQELMLPGPQTDELASYLQFLVKEQPTPTPYVAQNVTKEGQLIDVEVNWNYRRDEHGQVVGFVCILSDITERKKAEMKLLQYQRHLKLLTAQLTLLEEKQKRHIAGRLHDELAQCLVFCKLKLQSVKNSVLDGATAEEIKTVCEMLTQSLDYIRDVAYDLNSPVLKELGLEKAIRAWLKDDLESKHKIQTELIINTPVNPMNEDTKAFCFRSVRELTTNSIKHGSPDHIRVYINRKQDAMSVCVEDDGDGFDPEAIDSNRQEGFGLFSIREHLDHLGGSLKLISSLGHGCKAVLTVPLN